MVYRFALLLSFFFLTGCQTIDYIFFGEGTETTVVKKSRPVTPQEKKIKESTLSKDYYGWPIFQLSLDKQSEKFESALYYALQQSKARTQKARYRLVGWEKNKSTKSTLNRVKQKMIEWGIKANQIYIKTHKASRNQKHSKVRLYER